MAHAQFLAKSLVDIVGTAKEKSDQNLLTNREDKIIAGIDALVHLALLGSIGDQPITLDGEDAMVLHKYGI